VQTVVKLFVIGQKYADAAVKRYLLSQ